MNQTNKWLQQKLNLALENYRKNRANESMSLLTDILNQDKKNFEFILNAGVLSGNQNNLLDALIIFNFLEKQNFKDLRIFYNKGLIYSLLGNNQFAIESYKSALKIQPNDISTLINLGSTYNDDKQYEIALKILEKAVKLNPDIPEAWSNIGFALNKNNLYAESLDAYENAIKLNPNFYVAWSNKSIPLLKKKKFEEALLACETALSINPQYIQALLNKGIVLFELNRLNDALLYFEKAINLNPNYAEAWTSKGLVLYKFKLFVKALSCFERVLVLEPESADAYLRIADVLYELKLYNRSIYHYDKALSLNPDYPEVLASKGITLYSLKRYKESLLCLDKALSLKPDYAEALVFKGDALNDLKEHTLSAECYSKAFHLQSDHSYALGKMHHQMMLTCDWNDYDQTTNFIFDLIKRGKKAAEPFGFQGIADSEALLKKCAEIYSNDLFPSLDNLSEFSKYTHQKIRVGYMCGEFRKQATSILMARVWELHDKSKFELFAFDNGWDDGSAYRQRINAAFTKIIDISKLPDLDVAELIKSLEIDILVNLNGFFGLPRQKVFAYKPAPIQVNYLGFPGTIGAKYMDYIIADKVVIPESSKQFYTEKVVHLPHTYQANDNQRAISNKVFTRAELGLPENTFVFSSFNNNYKITPPVFDSWSVILKTVEKSVLWLVKDNSWAVENLKKEVKKRGVNPERIIFSERVDLPEHRARHSLADLFLDTWPYNAHTTASDALWAGLPVITMAYDTFPGRVASSLLGAIGLPELITNTPSEYENLAIDLAKNRQKLATVKEKLVTNRLNYPLFDSLLFTQHLEAAYISMFEKFQLGMAPDHIVVD